MASYFEQVNTFVHHNASDITKYVGDLTRRAGDAASENSSFIVCAPLVIVIMLALIYLEERAERAERLLEGASAEIAEMRKAARAKDVVALKEKERLATESKSLEGMLRIYREGSSQTIADSVKTLSIIRSICDDDQTRAAAKVASIKITLGVDEEEDEEGDGEGEGERESLAEHDPDFKLTKRSRRL